MEEKITLPDFDEWLENYKPREIKYNAAFNADTGKILTVGPDHTVTNKAYKNIINVSNEVAEDIISGKIRMSKCFVDAALGELEITEVKDLYSIDDVLHRIIEKKWSEVEKPDIFLTYNKSKGLLTVSLSEEFGGTHKLDKKFHPITKRKIFWDGQTELNFSITDYNDPHIVHKNVGVTISELNGKAVAISVDCPEKFSVYTKRLFKNYVIEVV